MAPLGPPTRRTRTAGSWRTFGAPSPPCGRAIQEAFLTAHPHAILASIRDERPAEHARPTGAVLDAHASGDLPTAR